MHGLAQTQLQTQGHQIGDTQRKQDETSIEKQIYADLEMCLKWLVFVWATKRAKSCREGDEDTKQGMHNAGQSVSALVCRLQVTASVAHGPTETGAGLN